jgi:hypothetical protein
MSNVVPLETAQAALISYLKSITTLVTALGNASQIKEWYWQGEDFKYPAVRLQMGTARAEGEPNCGKWLLPFYVMCFSEKKSSIEASQLASIVATIHGKQPGLLNGVDFVRFYVDTIIPPIRQDELTWRSEVVVHSTVNMPGTLPL